MGNEVPLKVLPDGFNSRAVGSDGESMAAELLVSKGYKILHRNWRYGRMGEIDLIAADPKGTTVFIEVKQARSNRFGPPEFRVDSRKQKQLYRLAQAYMKQNRFGSLRSRFDVIAISDKTHHIQNAFIRM